MNYEEYKNQLSELSRDFEKSKQKLAIQYAKINNSVKVGDVFTDHIGSVKVESIGFDIHGEPQCVYYGIELKKDGRPTLKGSKRQAYQRNIRQS